VLDEKACTCTTLADITLVLPAPGGREGVQGANGRIGYNAQNLHMHFPFESWRMRRLKSASMIFIQNKSREEYNRRAEGELRFTNQPEHIKLEGIAEITHRYVL
jgi:hypothetical protein